jgi:hypothetical protein
MQGQISTVVHHIASQNSHAMQEITLTHDPLAQLTEAGDGVDYCWLKISSRPTLFVNRPDLIQWLFTSPQVRRGRFVRLFSRFLGDGLLTSDGDAHDGMRQRMQRHAPRCVPQSPETPPAILRDTAEPAPDDRASKQCHQGAPTPHQAGVDSSSSIVASSSFLPANSVDR